MYSAPKTLENNSSYQSSRSSSHKFEFLDYDFEAREWSTENLRQAGHNLRVPRPRSVAWGIMLHTLPPPERDIAISMRSHRTFYNDLRQKLSMNPRAVIGDDPLSQNDGSAWKQHFCDNELKAVILQDVVRTFPDELYFRDKDVQDLMVRVLFYWTRSHSYVGYRQGMHEILAPILLELFQDRQFAPKELRSDSDVESCSASTKSQGKRKSRAPISETMKYLLADNYLEHDSFMLFSAVMRGVEVFYSTGDVVPNACGRLPTSIVAHNPNEVVKYLEKIKEKLLVRLDQELVEHLDKCNITLELFGIRWLRLLFGREFPRSEVPHLWGFLFADGPLLSLLHYVIIAMLMSIRTMLLASDAGSVLSILMRPSPYTVQYVCALALHLRAPLLHAPPAPQHPKQPTDADQSPSTTSSWELEQTGELGDNTEDSGSEGVAEGHDVARSLAALALVRARLPPAAARLAAALPRPPPHVAQPLQQILQLAALLQCRNHALVDVETALEAAEGHGAEAGRRALLPVAARPPRPAPPPPARDLREVPLKVFHQTECTTASDLPFQDPVRLRTE